MSTDFIQAISPYIAPVATVAGLGSNLFSSYKQNQLTNQQLNYQKFAQNLAKNPAAMNAYVAQFTQPLSQGLVQGVTNQVQGSLGERGLAASPAIATEIESQALAPYQMQSQQMGINEALQSLGLPNQAPRPNFPQQLNLSALIQQLLKPIQLPGDVTTISTAGASAIPQQSPNVAPPWAAPPDSSGPGITDIINSLINSTPPPALAGAS